MIQTKILIAMALLATVACTMPKDNSGNVSLENEKDMVAYGKVLFGKYCQQCHGENGTSMVSGVPNLAQTALTDEDEIGNIVFHGKAAMPAFEDKMGEPEIKAVSVFILSLKK